jgi:hypothetical protein
MNIKLASDATALLLVLKGVFFANRPFFFFLMLFCEIEHLRKQILGLNDWAGVQASAGDWSISNEPSLPMPMRSHHQRMFDILHTFWRSWLGLHLSRNNQ